ncbi:hypothetical protein BZA77DRAFT_309064 [Pyronema omphalodes]|nr:hypothetical protein BZA77DRAFT_309064 [Pyronema omphalodes]
MPTIDVQGKFAIITGAGSGINLSFARLLLSKGCSVLIADLSLTPLAESLLTTTHPHGACCLFKPTDVTIFSQLESLFPFAISSGLGVPDIVVTGAGIFEPEWSSFFHGDPVNEAESRYKTIDVNLVHPIKLTRLAISEFLKANKTEAAVIHCSSIAGQVGKLGTPIYSATKFGISGFVRAMAELESVFNIRISAVAPGIVKTPLWEQSPEKLEMFVEGKDEWVEPEEVAEAMLRLLEDVELPGGTVLEVAKNHQRVVAYFNDPGPGEAVRNGAKGLSLARGKEFDLKMLNVLAKEQGDTLPVEVGKQHWKGHDLFV